MLGGVERMSVLDDPPTPRKADRDLADDPSPRRVPCNAHTDGHPACRRRPFADRLVRRQWREYRAAELRERCPCATCREKHGAPPKPPTQLTVLSAAEARPLTVAGMRPVGSYAYHVDFSDGHKTGLYTLELLRELGEEVEPAP